MAKPRVWCEFTVQGNDGDLKLKIQDLTDDRIEECVDLFVRYLSTQETFHKVAGVDKNEEAQEESAGFFRNIMRTCNFVVCCEDDGTEAGGKLIGVSGMRLVTKTGRKNATTNGLPTKTKEMHLFLDISVRLSHMYDPMKVFELDSFYDGKGLVVHPDYRGLGIAQKLFAIRRVICKEERVPMTGALVSAYASQTAAERDGWKTIFEVSFEELGKRFGVEFEDTPRTCKYMVAKAVDEK